MSSPVKITVLKSQLEEMMSIAQSGLDPKVTFRIDQPEMMAKEAIVTYRVKLLEIIQLLHDIL